MRRVVARSVTPGDALFEPGVENILVSSSTNQARIVLEFARAALGDSEKYRWRNDGVTHLESRARVRIISSDARRSLGLGANVRIIMPMNRAHGLRSKGVDFGTPCSRAWASAERRLSSWEHSPRHR